MCRVAGRLTAALACALAACAFPATASAGRWVAGDLHVHTTYSHDSYGGPTDDNTGPEDVFTLGHTVTDDFASHPHPGPTSLRSPIAMTCPRTPAPASA